VKTLTEAGVAFELHQNHFSAGTPDTDWLPVVGRKRWCLLTADARIRYNELERSAVLENGLRMFYFSRNNLAGVEMAKALEKALPRMQKLFAETQPPFAASITKSGEVNPRHL